MMEDGRHGSDVVRGREPGVGMEHCLANQEAGVDYAHGSGDPSGVDESCDSHTTNNMGYWTDGTNMDLDGYRVGGGVGMGPCSHEVDNDVLDP